MNHFIGERSEYFILTKSPSTWPKLCFTKWDLRNFNLLLKIKIHIQKGLIVYLLKKWLNWDGVTLGESYGYRYCFQFTCLNINNLAVYLYVLKVSNYLRRHLVSELYQWVCQKSFDMAQWTHKSNFDWDIEKNALLDAFIFPPQIIDLVNLLIEKEFSSDESGVWCSPLTLEFSQSFSNFLFPF